MEKEQTSLAKSRRRSVALMGAHKTPPDPNAIAEGIACTEIESKHSLMHKSNYAHLYTAMWKRRGIDVVIKKFKHVPKGASDDDLLAQLKEIGSLNHEHLVEVIGYTLFSYGVLSGVNLVMEHYPLGNLEELLRTKQEKLEKKDGVMIVYQIALALEYLHKHDVIHRDICEQNVLIESLKPMSVKLADFGLSQLFKPFEIDRKPCRNRIFIPDEAFGHDEDMVFTKKGDIYMYGVLMLVVFTQPYHRHGYHPSLQRAVITKRVALDSDTAEFKYIIEKCLEESRDRPTLPWIIDQLSQHLPSPESLGASITLRQFVQYYTDTEPQVCVLFTGADYNAMFSQPIWIQPHGQREIPCEYCKVTPFFLSSTKPWLVLVVSKQEATKAQRVALCKAFNCDLAVDFKMEHEEKSDGRVHIFTTPNIEKQLRYLIHDSKEYLQLIHSIDGVDVPRDASDEFCKAHETTALRLSLATDHPSIHHVETLIKLFLFILKHSGSSLDRTSPRIERTFYLRDEQIVGELLQYDAKKIHRQVQSYGAKVESILRVREHALSVRVTCSPASELLLGNDLLDNKFGIFEHITEAELDEKKPIPPSPEPSMQSQDPEKKPTPKPAEPVPKKEQARIDILHRKPKIVPHARFDIPEHIYHAEKNVIKIHMENKADNKPFSPSMSKLKFKLNSKVIPLEATTHKGEYIARFKPSRIAPLSIEIIYDGQTLNSTKANVEAAKPSQHVSPLAIALGRVMPSLNHANQGQETNGAKQKTSQALSEEKVSDNQDASRPAAPTKKNSRHGTWGAKPEKNENVGTKPASTEEAKEEKSENKEEEDASSESSSSSSSSSSGDFEKKTPNAKKDKTAKKEDEHPRKRLSTTRGKIAPVRSYERQKEDWDRTFKSPVARRRVLEANQIGGYRKHVQI